MASRFIELIVDGHDTRRLAEFWCEVLGYRIIDEDEDNAIIAIGTEEQTADEVVRSPVPPMIVFIPVPEGKAVKNRLHIDVSPVDRDPPEEVERLLGLGASLADVGQGPDVPWTVMADPEGNEFCVLRRTGAVDSP